MTVDKSHDPWTGSHPDDIAEVLRAYSADGYPVERVAHAQCHECGRQEFFVLLDDGEGCASRICAVCNTTAWLLDSADFAEDAELEQAACPCGGERFNLAAGFALHEDGDVHWIYVGLRCVADGVLGCYADWKIDSSPTDHLFAQI